MTYFYLAIIILIGLAIFAGVTYNKLRPLSETTKESFSNIGVALNRKIEEIDRLASFVKSFQEFEQVTTLKISSDSTAASVASAYQRSQTVFSQIQGVAERFPQLQTNQRYQNIEESVRACERDVQSKRMIYNNAAKNFNICAGSIPGVFVAKPLGFPRVDYLEFDVSGVTSKTTIRELGTRDSDRVDRLMDMGAPVRTIAGSGFAQPVSQGAAPQVTMNERPALPAAPAGLQYFYLAPGGTPQGPTALEEIRVMVRQGRLPQNSMVAAVGSTQWIPFSQVSAGAR